MNNPGQTEIHMSSSTGPTFNLDKNTIFRNAPPAQTKDMLMMLDPSCITPTTPSQMEEDQQSNEGIVHRVPLAKEVDLAP